MEITVFSWLLGSQRPQIDVAETEDAAPRFFNDEIAGLKKEIRELDTRLSQRQRLSTRQNILEKIRTTEMAVRKLRVAGTIRARLPADGQFSLAFSGDLRAKVVGTWDDLPVAPPRWTPSNKSIYDPAKLTVPVGIIGFDHAADEARMHWCGVAALEEGWILAAHAIIQAMGPSYSFIAALDTQSKSGPSPILRWSELRHFLTPADEAA